MTTWRGWAARRLAAGKGLVAALFAVVALTTGILAGSLGNAGLLATRAAQAALANPVSGDAGLQVQTRTGDDPGKQDALVRETLAKSFAPIDISVWTTLASEPREVTANGKALAERVVMFSGDYLTDENLELTAGAWPTGPGEATLQADAAAALGLDVGATLTVADREVRISGLWRARDASAAMWLGNPLMRSGRDTTGYGPLVADRAVTLATGSPFVRWVVVPDVAAIKPEQLSALNEKAGAAAKAVEAADVSGRGLVVTGDLEPTAKQAAREAAAGDAFGFLPISVLILIAVVGLTQVAGLLAAARAHDEALLVARGASARQLLATSLGESLLVSAAGAVTGTSLALVLLRLVAGDWAQSQTIILGGVLGGLLAFACLGAVNVRATIRGVRGQARSADRVKNVAGAALLALVVTLAAVATWQLRSSHSFVRTDDSGRAHLDVISALAPALLLAVAAVIGLALLPPVARIVELLSRRSRSVGAWLAAAQAARGLTLHAVAVALTVLATGTATFAALFGGTAAVLTTDVAKVRQAAPLRVQLAKDLALPALADVDGVSDPIPVWRTERAQVGDRLLPLVVAPVHHLEGLVMLPETAALPEASKLVPAGSTNPPTIAAGTTELTIHLTATMSLDPWEAAALQAVPEAYEKNEGAPITAEALRGQLAEYEIPAEASVLLKLRDPATGLTSELTSEPLLVRPGAATHDPDFGNLRLLPGSADQTVKLALPRSDALVLDAVGFEVRSASTRSRLVEYSLTVAAGDTPLIGPATKGWTSSTAFPSDQFAPYTEAMEKATPARVTFEQVPNQDETKVGYYIATNRPYLPELELDTSGEVWTFTSRPLPYDQGGDPSRGQSAWVSPYLTYAADDPLGAYRAPETSTAAIPIAITPGTSASTTLRVGDAAEINAFGSRLPVVVAAITDAVPSVDGPEGILMDATAFSQSLARRNLEVPKPDEMWARVAGDPSAARAAIAAMPGVVAATAFEPSPGSGTARVAAQALWVAAACALALAIAGLAASAATMAATRRPEVAVLRALGMSAGAQARNRAVESGGVLGLATGLGVLAGWGVGWLVVSPVVLTATQTQPSFDLTLRFEWVPWIAMLGVGALVAAAIVAWQAATVRRQALDREYREEVR